MATIERVFSIKTSKVYGSAELLSKYDENTLFELRRDLKDKKQGALLCAICFQPLFLAGTVNQELHFRHKKDSDDCPIKTTNKLTKEEIEAMKFNGQKEGAEHKNNKLYIASILEKDPAFECVNVEKTFREENASGIAKHWRRPDVSATVKSSGLKMVFELQVSTTFLDVIIDRDNFYQRNNASILWVFLNFNNNTFTEKDIFYSSNMHAFVLDHEAKNMSDRTGRLHLKCHYIEYYSEDIKGLHEAEMQKVFREKLVAVDELKLNPESNKPFYFDVVKNKAEVKLEVKERTQALKAKFNKELEEAREKYLANQNGYNSSRVKQGRYGGNIKSNISAALYEKLKAQGKHKTLQCEECGNKSNFRSNACFITCNSCNTVIDW